MTYTKQENPFFQQLQNQEAKKVPVWYMRQAGRYLPTYQKLREKFSFEQLCKTPNLAAQVTFLPLEYLNVDALILFSDILFILEILDAKVYFDDQGPKISYSLKPEEIEKDYSPFYYRNLIHEKFFFIQETIKLVKQENKALPLIGFSGGPLSLIAYLISDHFKNQFKKLRIFLYQEEDLAHKILEKITLILIEYLSLQIEAGVDLIQIFDTWGFQFPLEQKKEFSFPYLNKIVDALKKRYNPCVPIFLFGKNMVLQEDFKNLKFDGFSCDANAPLQSISSYLNTNQWIQGNFDPYLLYAPNAKIKSEFLKMMHSMKTRKRYIFNLGHGVLPDISLDKIQYLTELVKDFEI